VALLARWPAGARAARSDGLVSGVDLAPTLLELAGAPVPARCCGVSFLPALRGEPFEGHEAVYLEKNFHRCYDPVRAVRTRTHKLVRSFREGMPRVPLPRDVEDGLGLAALRPDALEERPAEELYALAADPHEEHNLASDPALAAVRDGLRSRLGQWMRRTGDFLLTAEIPTAPEKQPWDAPEHLRPRTP
jgi:arylsulfatase A-like enzyme